MVDWLLGWLVGSLVRWLVQRNGAFWEHFGSLDGVKDFCPRGRKRFGTILVAWKGGRVTFLGGHISEAVWGHFGSLEGSRIFDPAGGHFGRLDGQRGDFSGWVHFL